MQLHRFTVMIALAAVLTSGHASGKECLKEEATLAEDAPGLAKSWSKMHEAYSRFGHCDDGSIGEAFSESIVHLLSSRWENVAELTREIKGNPAFRSFVIRHIDATTTTEDLNRIQFWASNKCPSGSAALCREIMHAAKEASRGQ